MGMKIYRCYSMKIEKAFLRMLYFKFLSRVLLCLSACIALFGALCSIAYSDGTVIDICKTIPGVDVAKAVDGKIIETKSLEGRCVYIIGFKETGVPNHAFVIYQHEASDYESLRDAMEGEIKPFKGIGDEAVISFDSETHRYWLLVVKREKVTFQVSGDSEDLVGKVAGAALKKLVP